MSQSEPIKAPASRLRNALAQCPRGCWRRTAARAGLPEDGALLKPAVAAAALLGAAEQEAVAIRRDLAARHRRLARRRGTANDVCFCQEVGLQRAQAALSVCRIQPV